MTAVVSVPISMAGVVGYQLGRGRPVPTKECPEIGRLYFCVPLFVLSGTGLFKQPDVEVQYFPTQEEAVAWGEADIERRLDEPRAAVRALVLEGVRQRREREMR